MSRKAGQIVALIAIIVLVVVVVWYQMSQENLLKSSVIESEERTSSSSAVQDLDGDGVIDSEDSDPNDKYKCRDTDVDMCDDCSYGYFNPQNDGYDETADGFCDKTIVKPVMEEEPVAEVVVEKPALKVTLVTDKASAVRGSPVEVYAIIENFNGEEINWQKVSGGDAQPFFLREAIDDTTVKAIYRFNMPLVSEDYVLRLVVGDYSEDITIKSVGSAEEIETEIPVEVVDDSGIPANPPYKTTEVDGMPQLSYMTAYDEITILDGLQMPLFIPSLNTNVWWIPDLNNFEKVVLEDEFAVKTAFKAPDKDGELKFTLKVQQGDRYESVANYSFTIVHPLIFSADANKDGKYDFSDLVNLLQNWDSYGDDATKVMAVILSRYEE